MWRRKPLLEAFLLLFLLFLAPAMGQQGGAWSVEQEGISTKYGGERVPDVKEGTQVSPGTRKVRREVIYKIDDRDLAFPALEVVRGRSLEEEAPREERKRELPRPGKKEEKKTLRAWCVLKEGAKITLDPVWREAECLTTEGEERLAVARIELIPRPREFALRGRVILFNGKRPKKSVVLDAKTRSPNVADRVDRRLLATILLRAGKETGRDVSGAVAKIFERSGKVFLGSGYAVAESDVETQLKNVPEASLYIALANLIEEGSDVLLSGQKSLPPLFEVRAGKELYVEVEF